jgi:hypothetical protein
VLDDGCRDRLDAAPVGDDELAAGAPVARVEVRHLVRQLARAGHDDHVGPVDVAAGFRGRPPPRSVDEPELDVRGALELLADGRRAAHDHQALDARARRRVGELSQRPGVRGAAAVRAGRRGDGDAVAPVLRQARGARRAQPCERAVDRLAGGRELRLGEPLLPRPGQRRGLEHLASAPSRRPGEPQLGEEVVDRHVAHARERTGGFPAAD